MAWGELPDLVRTLAALAFVIALMGGFAFLLKKMGLSGEPNIKSPKKRRLKMVESLALDARRKAVLLQRDDKQHLVILGPNSETIVESDITPLESDDQKN